MQNVLVTENAESLKTPGILPYQPRMNLINDEHPKATHFTKCGPGRMPKRRHTFHPAPTKTIRRFIRAGWQGKLSYAKQYEALTGRDITNGR